VGFWETYYHLVWATKQRFPYIDDAGAVLVNRSFHQTCQEAGVILRAVGIMPDHVHLALSIPPRWAVPQVVRELKVSATHAINSEHNLPYAGTFAWQHEFGKFTFGTASLEDVVHYVQNQREHHSMNRLRPRFEQIDRRGISS
jgi:putative transposase